MFWHHKIVISIISIDMNIVLIDLELDLDLDEGARLMINGGVRIHM